MPRDDSTGSGTHQLRQRGRPGCEYNWIALAGIAGFAPCCPRACFRCCWARELRADAHLSVVPHNPRFQRLVRSWKYAEEQRRSDQRLNAMYQEIPQEMRVRYAKVNAVCDAIRQNYRRLSSTSQIFAEQMEERLQGLLQGYVRLLHAAWQHREYLRTTDPKAVQGELASLEKSQDSDTPRVQEINRKRVEILNKRVEKFHKIQENCAVIDAQCAAVEDVLGLIKEINR